MKKGLIFLLAVLACQFINAQNVGIGTTTPTEKLQVTNGNIGLFNTTDSKNWRLTYVQTSNERFAIQEDGASRFSIANGGNVGIGTIVPNTKAILDIGSTTKGVLFPRMTTSQRLAITSPPNGLMVYDIDKNELHQYDGTAWKSILNNDYWIRPITSRNRITNPNDSIGIGTNSPTEWLDVNGNIRSRNNLLADNNITATGTITGAGFITTGNITALGTGVFNGNLTTNSNLSVAGTSLLSGNVTTNSDLIINNTTAILQLKSNNVNKGFFQLSGNDLKFGTNSGNTTGNVILRMDGDDMIDYFKGTSGIVMRLNNSAGANTGILQTITTGNKFLITNPIANGTIELGDEIYINPTLNRTGFGTTTPSERLHVNGNAFITGNTTINGNTTIYGVTQMLDRLIVNDTINTNHIGAASLAAGNGAFCNGTASGNFSFAVGNNVTAFGDGSCIIADGTVASINLHTVNRMLMRFNQGYRLYTMGDLSTGVLMNQGDNSWSSISDSTKKENFLSADGNSFLKKIAAMKLGSWNYKTQDKKIFRHYGPMAQEFDANFGNDGIGKIGNDTTIATADIDGVMMIAIQALIKEKNVLTEQNKLFKETQKLQEASINNLKENERRILERLEKLEAKFSGLK